MTALEKNLPSQVVCTTRLSADGRPGASRRRSTPRGLRFETLETRQMLSGGGLAGQYFHNADFTGLAFERTEAVSHPWGVGGPAPGVAVDSFSVRWSGQLVANYSELYTIRTVNDDGVRLWVDGQLLIDDWSTQGPRVESATVSLEAGQRYDIRLEYFDASGSAQMRLQWLSASQPLQDIPAAALYDSPAGLRGEYTDAFGGSGLRIDPTVDFDWAGGRPISGVAADNFRVRWTGLVRADYSEEYVFATTSDEGVRLWVGDQLIIDNWSRHDSTTDTGRISLEAGKWYDLRIEYVEAVGDAEMKLAWSSERQTGAGLFEPIASTNLRAAKETPLYVTNPLGPGADPFVIRWQESYLLVRSSGSSVWIDRADRLEDIHSSDPASVSVRAWRAPAGTAYSTMIWAPELHQIGGKWYIYVAAAEDNDNATHRMYVLERDSADPFGSYVFKGRIAAPDDRWAIDGTVVQWQQKLYFVWSGWPGGVDGQQNLYIAEMSNPWTISGQRVLLSSPTHSWERHGLPINEGPQALIHDGRLHIIYSASGYWTDQYALGRLTYDGVGDVMNPSSWSKAASPVFKATAEVVGVGHASFTVSPDGTEPWIVYHAHHDPGPFNDDRDVRIQPFTFSANGVPAFGAPLPNSAKISAPSGTPDPNRRLLEGDFDADGAVGQSDLDVLTAQLGYAMPPGVSADGDGDGVVDGADFLLWQRRYGAAATEPTALAASTGALIEADADRALASADKLDRVWRQPARGWWIDALALDQSARRKVRRVGVRPAPR